MNKVDNRFSEKIGTEYDLFPLASPHYKKLQQKVAQIVREFSSSTSVIIEIGCGTGLTTLELVNSNPEAKIIAIDAEEIMVEQARKVLEGTNVELVCSDALEYLRKQNDLSIDVVVSAFCFHNTPPEYRQKVFKEISRVLKSGGLCVNGDKIAQDNSIEHQKSLEEQIKAFGIFSTTNYPELQAEWTEHYLEDEKIKLTESEQRELLGIAGCNNIKLHKRWLMDAIFVGVKK